MSTGANVPCLVSKRDVQEKVVLSNKWNKKNSSKIDFNTPMLKLTLVKKTKKKNGDLLVLFKFLTIPCFLSVQYMVYLPYCSMHFSQVMAFSMHA